MYNPKMPDFYTWLAWLFWSAGEGLSEVTLALERHYSLEPLLRERLLDAYQNNLSEEERRLRMREFVDATLKADICRFEGPNDEFKVSRKPALEIPRMHGTSSYVIIRVY
jgi:hypothetical protein